MHMWLFVVSQVSGPFDLKPEAIGRLTDLGVLLNPGLARKIHKAGTSFPLSFGGLDPVLDEREPPA
ncbi:hypothetical protein ACJ72_08720 [Emergomyces africanus]|uniref:Uncharacterized protein n=1 Tax=Emergomyces africanus TaxID=1955775 RepID=A0A1B7NJY4_9EURO|nr:hypothetical protein ACJ72_08720 [Emergomyces africanus]